MNNQEQVQELARQGRVVPNPKIDALKPRIDRILHTLASIIGEPRIVHAGLSDDTSIIDFLSFKSNDGAFYTEKERKKIVIELSRRLNVPIDYQAPYTCRFVEIAKRMKP